MSRRRKKRYDRGVYQSFAMIMQFGINMLVPICLMSALGIYLDKRLGTSFWMIILFIVGAIAGGQNVYRLAKQIYAPSNDKRALGKAEDEEKNGKGENI